MTTTPCLPPAKLKAEIPLSFEAKKVINNFRKNIINILEGKDSRLILILGPCSIHNCQEAIEYATKLKKLQKHVKENFLILMRVHFAKPRTSFGWKGLLFDPLLDNSHDIALGIKTTRQLLISLANIGIGTATEILDLNSVPYFSDIISWGCIGARTCESQTHREVASGLTIPIAFKNNTEGNVKAAINGAVCASKPHHYFGICEKGQLATIKTQGNRHTHIVLRGGKSGPNFDPESINQAASLLKQTDLFPKIIIDCSHDNSKKNHQEQIRVFQSVISQAVEGNDHILGAMIESNLLEGNQTIDQFNPKVLHYGISVTDSCLDWQTTEQLIFWGNEKINSYFLKNKTHSFERCHAKNLISS